MGDEQTNNDSYAFEISENRGRGTDPAALAAAVSTFRKRLKLGAAWRTDLEPLFERYCQLYPLNIDWYATNQNAQKKSYHARLVLAVAVTLLALAATTAAALSAGAHGGVAQAGLLASEIAVVTSGAFGTLRILSAAGDPKARMSVFWKARAALSKRIYTFESTWRGRSAEAHFEENFEKALNEELDAARAIGDEEEEAFFKTWADPADVLKAGGTALDEVSSKGKAVFDAFQKKMDDHKKRSDERLAAIIAYYDVQSDRDQAAGRVARAEAALKEKPDDEARKKELQQAKECLAASDKALRDARLKTQAAFGQPVEEAPAELRIVGG